MARGVTSGDGRAILGPERLSRMSRTPGRTAVDVQPVAGASEVAPNHARRQPYSNAGVAGLEAAPGYRSGVQERKGSNPGNINSKESLGLGTCSKCLNLPDSCLPWGWQLGVVRTVLLDEIAEKGKALYEERLKLLGSASDPTAGLAEWGSKYRAFRAWSQKQLATFLEQYELWSSAPKCLSCKQNTALMKEFVAECCAVWTFPNDGPSTSPPSLVLPPVEICGTWKQGWFPSIMSCVKNLYAANNLGSQTLGVSKAGADKPVLPVLVAVRRDTQKRSSLLAKVYEARAWRSLPSYSGRRFWARVFGDTESCEIGCDSENGKFGYADATFVDSPWDGSLHAECASPPIPYAFGLPPILPSPSWPGEPIYPSYTMMTQYPSSMLQPNGGTPVVPFTELSLYVSAWPIAVKVQKDWNSKSMEAVGPAFGRVLFESEIEASGDGPTECRMVLPNEIPSPSGADAADWIALAQSESTKWKPCASSCAWPSG